MKLSIIAASLVVLVALVATTANATVMGVDLGGEFIKLSAPSGNNIEIVLNEQSHRKSSNFVGFRGPERYFAEEARNLMARFPDNMVTMLNRVVGVPLNDTKTINYLLDNLHYKLQLVEDENGKGTVAYKIGTGESVVQYSAEELLGMLFTYMKMTTENHIDGPIREAVVTVPHFYTPRQRQAIVDSAALAGLRVISLLHSTTATALQYGMQNRGFGDETKTVLFYDMGTTRTEVGVYTYSPTQGTKRSKKPKFAESLGTITTLSIVSDPFLGGRSFDSCIANLIDKEFLAKTPEKITGGRSVLKPETTAQRKSVISLLRAANKAKEVLSANKQAPITIEGIAPDRDFATVVTRETFEKECHDLFERASSLVTAAVDKAGIDITTIQKFELMGGAVRIPKLVHDLGIAFGRVPDRTLNSDEAAALGAGYVGASQSGHFKIKGFAIKDTLPYHVHFQLSPRPERPDEVPAIRPIFQNSVIPSRKSINVNRTENFAVRLFTVDPNDVKKGDDVEPERNLDVSIEISGVKAALDGVDFFDRSYPGSENNTHTIKVELRASESGLVSVEAAETIITYASNVSKKVKVNKTEEELDAEKKKIEEEEAAEKAKEEAEAAEEEAKKEQVAKDETAEEEKSSESTEEDKKEAAKKPAKKAKKAKKTKTIIPHKFVKKWVIEMKKKMVPLKITPTFSFPATLTKAEAKESRNKLRALNAADDLKRATAAAKNDLETYLMWVKYEGVLDNAAVLAKFPSEEALEKFKALVTKTQDWFDEEATDDTTKEEYLSKLSEIKAVVHAAISGESEKKQEEQQSSEEVVDKAGAGESTTTDSGATADGDSGEASTEDTGADA